MINKFSIINEAKHFSLGIFQNFLVFILAIKYIKYFHGSTQIYSWKSNGMLKESKSDSNFVPDFVDNNSLPDIGFNGRCLIKNNTSISEKVINLYISYTLGPKL